MPFQALPKELRLRIWAIAYHTQPPRYVTLRTFPHFPAHDEDVFCPRYSPTPAPVVLEVCQESRAEAFFQARKHGHIVTLPNPIAPSHTDEGKAAPTLPFFFRFDTDIFYFDLDPTAANHKSHPATADAPCTHFDASNEYGVLGHFSAAQGCDPTALTKLAIRHDTPRAGLLKIAAFFPKIQHMYFVIQPEDMEEEARNNVSMTIVVIVDNYRIDVVLYRTRILMEENPGKAQDKLDELKLVGELREICREQQVSVLVQDSCGDMRTLGEDVWTSWVRFGPQTWSEYIANPTFSLGERVMLHFLRNPPEMGKRPDMSRRGSEIVHVSQ